MIKEIYVVLNNSRQNKLDLSDLIKYFNILLKCGYPVDILLENINIIEHQTDDITKLTNILLGTDNSYRVINNQIQSIKMSPEILTFTGKYFNFLNPTFDMIDIEDISRGLSKTCRFNGQCNQYYSVAQHSVIASFHVPQQYQFQTLMHDASEAYLGDVVTTLKQLLLDYQKIEANVESVIFRKYGLPEELNPFVKRIDYKMFEIEFDELMIPQVYNTGLESGIKIDECWDHEKSYQEFMTRFNELYNVGE